MNPSLAAMSLSSDCWRRGHRAFLGLSRDCRGRNDLSKLAEVDVPSADDADDLAAPGFTAKSGGHGASGCTFADDVIAGGDERHRPARFLQRCNDRAR